MASVEELKQKGEEWKSSWADNTTGDQWADGVQAALERNENVYSDGVQESVEGDNWQEGVAEAVTALAGERVNKDSVRTYDWKSQTTSDKAQSDWVSAVQDESNKKKYDQNTGSDEADKWGKEYARAFMSQSDEDE